MQNAKGSPLLLSLQQRQKMLKAYKMEESRMTKDTYKIGIVKYTDHASLNRLETGMKRGLDELSKKTGKKFEYEGLVYDGSEIHFREKQDPHGVSGCLRSHYSKSDRLL